MIAEGKEGEMGEKKEAKMRRFARGIKAEWGKIIWPSKKTLGKQTAAVAIVSAAIGAVIAILDFLLQTGLNALISL